MSAVGCKVSIPDIQKLSYLKDPMTGGAARVLMQLSNCTEDARRQIRKQTPDYACAFARNLEFFKVSESLMNVINQIQLAQNQYLNFA